MTLEAIDLKLTIGASVYTLTAVGDVADALFAYQVGRGVSEAILEHSTKGAT